MNKEITLSLTIDLIVSTKVLEEKNLFLIPLIGSNFENFGSNALGVILNPT